ncbi:MAG: hypothetical protein ACJ768_23960 [Gaiellaceae bacterium]
MRSLAARTADARTGALRSHAFGLDVEAAFDAPGLPPGAPRRRLPSVRLELAARAEIDARWRPAMPERLLEEEFGGATPARTIDRDEALGYRLYARHFGLALISPDGDQVLCAPPGVAAWRWQRFLVGRVLPWAAVLRGREVFHASAVRVGDHAIAFAGATGFGKTSLALRMVMRGAGFVTDDVLAIERDPSGVALAHPGASILSVRPAERALLGRGELRRVGRVLGSSGKTYVALEREQAPLPLGSIYFLAPGRGHGTRIEPCRSDPRLLLGSSFVASVATPERLARVLDVCAAISQGVPLFRAHVDPDAGSAALAAAIHEHALASVEVAA